MFVSCTVGALGAVEQVQLLLLFGIGGTHHGAVGVGDWVDDLWASGLPEQADARSMPEACQE